MMKTKGTRTYIGQGYILLTVISLILPVFLIVSGAWKGFHFASQAHAIDDSWLANCVDRVSHSMFSSKCKTTWKDYKLEDCFDHCVACGRNTPLQTGTTRQQKNMAEEYSNLACSEPKQHQSMGNITLIEKIVKDYRGLPGFLAPDPDSLVIHLKLGDILEGNKHSVSEMLTRGADPPGIHDQQQQQQQPKRSIKSAYEYAREVKEANVTTVILRGGAHQDYCHKSLIYATCLQRSIKRVLPQGQVELQINEGTPDQDFFFLAHAKKLSVAFGSFSAFAAKLAENSGGQIIGRRFL